MAHMSKGIHTKYSQQLYLSIAIPCMLYTADIFLTPQQNIGKKVDDTKMKQAIITKLTAIQCWAAIMIMGTMRTTESTLHSPTYSESELIRFRVFWVGVLGIWVALLPFGLSPVLVHSESENLEYGNFYGIPINYRTFSQNLGLIGLIGLLGTYSD